MVKHKDLVDVVLTEAATDMTVLIKREPLKSLKEVAWATSRKNLIFAYLNSNSLY